MKLGSLLKISYLIVYVLNIFDSSVRSAAAVEQEDNQSSGCIKPVGGYESSCTNTTIELYNSSDQDVPPSCVFETTCATIFTGLPPKHNKIYLPLSVMLDLDNNNGTVIHNGKPLTKSSNRMLISSFQQDPCHNPPGSYSKTCKVKADPYVSTDPSLESTELCRAKAVCKSLGRESSSTLVYFNKHIELSKTKLKIENCNGDLVANSDDTRCLNKEPETILKISKKEGSKGKLKY